MMIGISGYGKAGNKYFYYHCKNHKKGNRCTTHNIRAEVLEKAVEKALNNIVMSDELIHKIASRIYEMNTAKRNYSLIDTIKAQIADTESGIKNVLTAIKNGVISQALTEELTRLENQKIELTYSLEQEKAKAPEITQEQLEYILLQFREDCHNPEYADKLIDAFVNRIYYTDGQLAIWLNYTKQTADETPEIEKIIIDTIKNREQLSSVLCDGGPSGTRILYIII